MNTLEVQNPSSQIAARSAALPTPSPAPPVLPPDTPVAGPAASPKAPEINPPQSPPPPVGLAARLNGVLGKVHVLSALEEERFGICEEAIQSGSKSCVDVGLPLGEIRDERWGFLDRSGSPDCGNRAAARSALHSQITRR